MTETLISTTRTPTRVELLDLYGSVGWTKYTADPDSLVEGVANSLRVATAWDQSGVLVGLARVVGDGHTIAYLQDVLVRPEWQRTGVGRWLMDEVFAPYMHVRQQVLMADDEPRQRAFYEALGFAEIRDLENETRVFVRSGAQA